LGADLGNLVHRDYDSVLRDILNPNATINPDAIGYAVLLTSGKTLNGIRMSETADELRLAVAGGEIQSIDKLEIETIAPMKDSLMPSGIDELLSPDELRDLMTYLLRE
jgi:putative heme-binding domain-containing protein